MKRSLNEDETEEFGRRILSRLHQLQNLVQSTLFPSTPPGTPILVDLTTESEEPEPEYISEESESEPEILIEIHHTINMTEDSDEDEEDDHTEEECDDSSRTLGSEDTWSLEEGETADDQQFIVQDTAEV